MIKCHLLDGRFEEKEFEDFDVIAQTINKNREKLYELEIRQIIEILCQLGRKIIKDKEINRIQGVGYIAMWLRKDRLEDVCRINYMDESYYEEFTEASKDLKLCMQPRGIVCHSVAGNIPTLAFFSVVQAILSKNGSIVKVPEHTKDIILAILKHLDETSVVIDGTEYHGKDIVKSISLVCFEGKDQETSKKFSIVADCKVIWGGSDAVKAVTTLPQKEHCEIISYGPKYSFGVFDREYIENGPFEKALEGAASDVAVFNQMACSSPHVYFFEKSNRPIMEIANILKRCFESLPEKLLRQEIPESTASRIINARGMYFLDSEKWIVKPEDLSWTILVNKDIRLEEPVQGKVVFLKEVESVDLVLDLITRKIQAMSVSIRNDEKRRAFAKKAAYRGVDRIVPPGKMHEFDLPWDGILGLNRMVRWVILKDK
ncbi:MAG: acyl-CoA reductase [Candidatus Altiarchaeia archaeon]